VRAREGSGSRRKGDAVGRLPLHEGTKRETSLKTKKHRMLLLSECGVKKYTALLIKVESIDRSSSSETSRKAS